MSLDLSLAAIAAEDRGSKLSEEDRIVQQSSAPIRILFDLPDGTQIENEFQMGQTVEVLKSFVELECGISMGSQRLYLEGGTCPLLDPMSLLDYPEVRTLRKIKLSFFFDTLLFFLIYQIAQMEEVIVRVEGEMDEGGAKK